MCWDLGFFFISIIVLFCLGYFFLCWFLVLILVVMALGFVRGVFLVFAYLFLIEAMAFEIETSLNECLLLCFAPVRYRVTTR